MIERIINSTGATAYKFRASRDGKVLADKRETLTRIVDRFGLHIDSPLTVLTQDQARSFLQSSDPKSLYRVCLVSRISLIPVLPTRNLASIIIGFVYWYWPANQILLQLERHRKGHFTGTSAGSGSSHSKSQRDRASV